MTQPPGRVSARVRTDAQIIAFGNDLMKMFDAKGETIQTATRDDTAKWTVTGGKVNPAVVDTRNEAIDQMNARAVGMLHPGLSVQVPYGLRETP